MNRGKILRDSEVSYGVAAGDAAVSAGEAVVVVLVVFVVLVVDVSAGEGLAAVVVESAGAFTSVFCSQAARSAVLARMQMYFFIVVG